MVAMLAALLVVAAPSAMADPPDDYATAAFQLTILHNNDGESQLVNAGSGLEDYGGAARFKATRRLNDSHQIEAVGEKLRGMMPWIAKNKLVDKEKN